MHRPNSSLRGLTHGLSAQVAREVQPLTQSRPSVRMAYLRVFRVQRWALSQQLVVVVVRVRVRSRTLFQVVQVAADIMLEQVRLAQLDKEPRVEMDTDLLTLHLVVVVVPPPRVKQVKLSAVEMVVVRFRLPSRDPL